jgi:nucleotide-binding universal stress UspA family protein
MRRVSLFRTILCPVDFSNPSALALRYADRLARRSRSRLTVTYVNDPLLVAASAAALQDRDLVNRSRRELATFVSATLGRSRRTGAKLIVSVGAAAREIIKTARRTRADLIVMGTHGLTGATRVLVGSTTLQILQRTTIPVLAVRRQNDAASAPTAEWPGKRIVAPVDLTRTAATDVEAAAAVASGFGATLLLIHVVPRLPTPGWFPADLSRYDRMLVAEAQRKMERLGAVARRHVPTDVLVVPGWPADEIAAAAANERAELVITTLSDRRKWFRSTRGSISYQILSQIVPPVLALPPRWRPRQ